MITLVDKVKMFREIVNEMANLYEKKNANYGDSFGQLYDSLGPVSGLVPLHNKLDRATSLIKGDKNNFESLEDTFKDLACYAIMNLIEMKTRNQKIEDAEKVATTSFPYVSELTPNNSDAIKSTDPCAGCPWNPNQLWNNNKTPYLGDTPCQWCEHGTKLTCKNINYCTATPIDNKNNIKIWATSSTGLEDSVVGSINPTTATSIMKDGTGERVLLETSGMIDEYWDIDLDSLYTTNMQDDDLTTEEMAEVENLYSQYLTKRRG